MVSRPARVNQLKETDLHEGTSTISGSACSKNGLKTPILIPPVIQSWTQRETAQSQKRTKVGNFVKARDMRLWGLEEQDKALELIRIFDVTINESPTEGSSPEIARYAIAMS
eukprot:767033-Hanusia_phi.AAC.2